MPQSPRRADLFRLQRELSSASDAPSFAHRAPVFHVFVESLPPSETREQLRVATETLTVRDRALFQRAAAFHRATACCRRLHREATFEGSPPVSEAVYAAFLEAAIAEAKSAVAHESLSLHSIEARSRLDIEELHGAAARAFDEQLIFFSEVDEPTYAVQLKMDDARQVLSDLGRTRSTDATPPKGNASTSAVQITNHYEVTISHSTVGAIAIGPASATQTIGEPREESKVKDCRATPSQLCP